MGIIRQNLEAQEIIKEELDKLEIAYSSRQKSDLYFKTSANYTANLAILQEKLKNFGTGSAYILTIQGYKDPLYIIAQASDIEEYMAINFPWAIYNLKKIDTGFTEFLKSTINSKSH